MCVNLIALSNIFVLLVKTYCRYIKLHRNPYDICKHVLTKKQDRINIRREILFEG